MALQLWPTRSALENTQNMAQTTRSEVNLLCQPLIYYLSYLHILIFFGKSCIIDCNPELIGLIGALMIIIPVILCGGSGTRLWPLSRTEEPKQLQVLFGDHSLFEHTLMRLQGLAEAKPPLVICNKHYADEIDAIVQAGEYKICGIIEEPFGRDTAAAAALAAHHIAQKFGNDAIMVLLPADHFVGNVAEFQVILEEAARIAEVGEIATIGIEPTHPETGYGYILRSSKQIGQTGGYCVDRFVEKPDLETAKSYLADGNYLWNAGIFAMKAGHFLSELHRFEPDIAAMSSAAFDEAQTVEATRRNHTRLCLPANIFGKIPKKSIDYAVMEKTDLIAVIPGNFDWTDVGNWSSVKSLGAGDTAGNVVEGRGVLFQTKNTLVRSPHRLTAVIGLDDAIVIDTNDALLICRSDLSHEVKNVHGQLVLQNDVSALNHGANSSNFEARMRSWAKKWLFEVALPFWSEVGVDPLGGGVHEALDSEGSPLVDMPKRFRVQARQVYTFAHAYHLGWAPGIEALQIPLDFMMRHCRLDGGGWGHIYNRFGEVQDDALDTYDQAFALLALGWAYKVTGEPALKQAAKDTLGVLNTVLRHRVGGFKEGEPSRTARRANPHMHLLEAAMWWMELHNDDEMAALADEVVDLYRKHFCIDGLLREFFNEDLTLLDSDADPALLLVEPGHQVEWAYLLRRYGQLSGKPTPETATLEAFATTFGVNPKTGLLMDQCATDGSRPVNVTSRLWPQTEYIRLKLGRPEIAERHRALVMLHQLRKSYLTVDGNENGFWCDRLDAEGQVVDHSAPASSFYHILGCVEPLIRKSVL